MKAKKKKMWIQLDWQGRYKVRKMENSAVPSVRSFLTEKELTDYCDKEHWTVYVESKK